jgi:release factor glutamine methyltransferase
MSCADNLAPADSDNPPADDSLDVAAALDAGCRTLQAHSGGQARREALFLLSGILQIAPGAAAMQRDRRLTADQRAEYEARLARRARGEPLQYIEGRAAFRQLNLRVDPSVLIPRPETELLVERVLERCKGREGLRALDLGSGSGAIALSLACEGGFDFVVGFDISPAALNLARYNTAEAGIEGGVEWRPGSLYSALHPGERFDVIVSNPPYIANGEAESLPPEVRDWEPAVALFAGPTGLEVIEEIVTGAPRHLVPGGLLALEVAPGVATETLALIRSSGSFGEPELLADLVGLPRIVLAVSEE